MPILDNEFTCPNNHVFKANAKIRARCPQCGQMAKRDFLPVKPSDDTKPVVKSKQPIKQTVLLRAGRPRMAVRKPKPKVAPKTKTVAHKTKPALKSVARKLAPVKPTRASNGLVKTHHLKTRGTMPKVKRPPSKTAVARHINDQAPRRYGSYMDEVVDRYGRF